MKKEIEDLAETLVNQTGEIGFRNGVIIGITKWIGLKAMEERPDFPAFINNTELSDADKNLIKGVYYDWLSNPKENA